MNAEHAISLIENAFSDMPLPPHDRIAAEATLDVDLVPMMDIYASRARRELTLDLLAGQHDLVAFMTPEALVYFLPALMELILREPVNGATLYSMVETLFLIDTLQARGDAWNERMATFMNRSRMDAVEAFFRAYEAAMPGDVDFAGLGISR